MVQATSVTNPDFLQAMAPNPEQEITVSQASKETGLAMRTLRQQIANQRIPARLVDERGSAAATGRKRFRSSGGGKTLLITRRALHLYLVSRLAGRGAKPVKKAYRAPRGMEDYLERGE